MWGGREEAPLGEIIEVAHWSMASGEWVKYFSAGQARMKKFRASGKSDPLKAIFPWPGVMAVAHDGSPGL